MTFIRRLESLTIDDLPTVGGKNASLGELIKHLRSAGVKVPEGFALTTAAHRRFLATDGLGLRIEARLAGLDVEDLSALQAAGRDLRKWHLAADLPPELSEALGRSYEALWADADVSLAVRSSATAEDLPEASFAGQQESYLNVRGLEDLKTYVKHVYSSLYTDRAIAYRQHQGFAHADVELSVCVQRMVRSDLATSGVAFSLDTESGFKDAVFISSSYGLGEAVVQGAVNPDEFYVYKPALKTGKKSILSRRLGTKEVKHVYADRGIRAQAVSASEQQQFSLTDEDIVTLAQYVCSIEAHYAHPVDVEWAKDGLSGEIYIVQARPETVHLKTLNKTEQLERYRLTELGELRVLGRSVGERIGAGRVRIVEDIKDMHRVQTGDVLVTDMTNPDWEPVMKRASALVTNRGGRTCHAAIIARELGIPAVVGTGDATDILNEDEYVTVSCAEGESGFVYAGELAFEVERRELTDLPELGTKLMLNVASPDAAYNLAKLPSDGVGLARLEFVISSTIGIHPKAILDHSRLEPDLRAEVERRTSAYASPRSFYISKLSEGIATLAAAFAPRPVIVRMSDFKSNEYAKLLGGELYEPDEENPMIGLRGASRYRSADFQACFELECEAINYVRTEMGLDNVQLMIPFVRTPNEAAQIVALLAQNGLERAKDKLKLIMMCEVPSNALLAEAFLEHFDGFSIGSNDLTQLTLALDRDSGLVADLFSEEDAAVKALIKQTIQACHTAGKYVGICGQGPSDHPEFAKWLLAQGISSMSLNPDTLLVTHERLGASLSQQPHLEHPPQLEHAV